MAADAVGLSWPALLLGSGRLPIAATAVVCLLLFHGSGMYRPHLQTSILDELPSLVARSVAGALIVGIGVRLLGERPGISVFALLATLAIVSQPIARMISYRVIAGARAKGYGRRPTVIVGSCVVTRKLARTLKEDTGYGLRVIGFADDNPRGPLADEGIPHLGKIGDLPAILRSHGVHVLLIGFHEGSDTNIVEMLRMSADIECELFVVPRLFEIQAAFGLSDHIGAIPITRIRFPRCTGFAWRVKRMVDIAVSLLAVGLLLPVLGLVALAVFLEDRSSVLFRQVRVGKDGQHFELLKFRSMKPADDAESATRWNIAGDKRVGPVGKVIRTTSLDELPQLWNILRGDMTLVGPRPERPHFVDRFGVEYPSYRHRHRVPAGLTGLAQVNGLRGDTSIEERARFDNFYIENWSLWFDTKIILRTVREVIFARGR